MRIVTHFSNGKYYYLEAASTAEDEDCIEVPDELVQMWNAAADAFGVMQEQLRRLDDEQTTPSD